MLRKAAIAAGDKVTVELELLRVWKCRIFAVSGPEWTSSSRVAAYEESASGPLPSNLLVTANIGTIGLTTTPAVSWSLAGASHDMIARLFLGWSVPIFC
jgi:hypothetical protein